jgi:hypothetical protein
VAVRHSSTVGPAAIAVDRSRFRLYNRHINNAIGVDHD